MNIQPTEKDDRFRALVTATADAIYRVSADWSVMLEWTGRGLLAETRVANEKWMGKYIHPEDISLVTDAIKHALEDKSVFNLEHRIVKADGSTAWVMSHAVPLFDENGEILEWFGTATDTSYRKGSETSLRSAKEKAEQQLRLYETITSSTPDLIYVFDLHYRFTYANEALLTMWGKTWDNAIGRRLIENGYEAWHAEMHEREIDQVVATKMPIRGEVSFPHATFGRRIYDYIFTPVFNQRGEVEAIAGTTRDITDIRLAEITLGESEARFRNMAEGTNIYIAMTDEVGRAIYFNQAWTELTGRSEEALIGFGWADLLHPDDRKTHLATFADAVAKLAPLHDSFRIMSSDGRYRWLLVDGSVRRYDDGSFAGYIGAAIDITGMKEDEQLKNDFISTVSHELKTPLASTLAYVQLSKRKAVENKDDYSVTLLERTENQVRKMTEMINSFLNLSRLESARIQIEPTQIDIAKLMKEIEQDTEATVTTHQVLFNTTPQTWLTADYDKIAQVIQNFISNAVKYSAKNTTVQVSCTVRTSEVEIAVRDEGIGIRPEDLPHVFERFFRVRDSETRNISGFGIGLFLCAEIVKGHEGKIWVDSARGKGSSFHFTIPVR